MAIIDKNNNQFWLIGWTNGYQNPEVFDMFSSHKAIRNSNNQHEDGVRKRDKKAVLNSTLIWLLACVASCNLSLSRTDRR